MSWTSPRTYVDGEILTASILNVDVRDNLNWLFTGEASWTNASSLGFLNGYTDYDTTAFGPVRFKKVGGWTFITGLIVPGTLGLPAWILPVGYRPHVTRNFPTAAADTAHPYNVSVSASTGNVFIGANSGIAGAGGWASMHCSFPAEN